LSIAKNLHNKPEVKQFLNEVHAVKNQLAEELSKGNLKGEIFNILEERKNLLEKKIVAAIPDFDIMFQRIEVQQIQKKLKYNEVAIEFVKYDLMHGVTDEIKTNNYAASIVYKNGLTEFIPLFEEVELRKIIENNFVSNLNQLYASRGVSPTQIRSQEGLYELIWSKIESKLSKINRVYFSPTGLLNKVNISALVDPNGTYLFSKYDMHCLQSTRLLAYNNDVINDENRYVLIGGINYNLDTTLNNTDISLTTNFETSLSRSNVAWSYLPGTLSEIKAIEEELTSMKKSNVSVFEKDSATEYLIKNIDRNNVSPRLLHIATHGFFFPENDTSAEQKNKSVFQTSNHPMMRSGLILAGANYAWLNGHSFQNNEEDGILTAYEISQMQLQNTELVVLSACETGLGDIRGNEGVYGLQRAFKIAGAKYVMMSLWQVPDAETKEFMETFYAYWIQKKMNISKAFKATQSSMSKKYNEPFKWAGFVLLE
jgi:CHAT domain-containing protein